MQGQYESAAVTNALHLDSACHGCHNIILKDCHLVHDLLHRATSLFNRKLRAGKLVGRAPPDLEESLAEAWANGKQPQHCIAIHRWMESGGAAAGGHMRASTCSANQQLLLIGVPPAFEQVASSMAGSAAQMFSAATVAKVGPEGRHT